jgi:REP element-mobilizing transposase RayT
MPNTYTRIYIHLVFAVLGREALISPSFREELYKEMTGIATKLGHKLLQIGGMPDHVHVLIGMKPSQALSTLVEKVKSSSSLYVNKKRLLRGRFYWQEGFGGFSVSHSQLGRVIRYIQTQEEHHRKQSFVSEYRSLLRKYAIEYDERYLFAPVEDDTVD